MIDITYYGHSAFLVKIQDIKIVFDPFISPNPRASQIDISTIEADYPMGT
jgi:L-ascorbate metabolism protein UlaG (beta-lactamase superfamily)